MNAETVLTLASDALRAYLKSIESPAGTYEKMTTTPAGAWDFEPVAGPLLQLRESAREEIARKAGAGSALTAAKAALRDVKNRPGLYGGHIREDGKQEICNGYAAAVLNTPLPLPECEGMASLRKLIDGARAEARNSTPVDVAAIAAALKSYQAENGKKRPVMVQVGNAYYNPVLLLQIFAMLPGADLHQTGGPMSAAYVAGDAGEGLLMPVRRDDAGNTPVIYGGAEE